MFINTVVVIKVDYEVANTLIHNLLSLTNNVIECDNQMTHTNYHHTALYLNIKLSTGRSSAATPYTKPCAPTPLSLEKKSKQVFYFFYRSLKLPITT